MGYMIEWVKEWRDTMQELTQKQETAFNYIKQFIDSNGYAPTISEIGNHMMISISVARTVYVEALEKKGYIQRLPGKARAMRVLK